MTLTRAFSATLKINRKRAELTQEELAEKAGLDRTYISLMERGHRRPTLETIFNIAKALQLTPEEFVAEVRMIKESR